MAARSLVKPEDHGISLADIGAAAIPGMAETEFSLVRFRDAARADALYAGLDPLRGEDVAECIRWCLALPDHVNIDEMIVKCRDQASHTMAKVHRRG